MNLKKIWIDTVLTSLFTASALCGGSYYNNSDVAIGGDILKALIIPSEEETPPAELSIIENVSNNESLTTLAKALQAADLTNVLKGNGPFTLFAPNDRAFEQLPAGALQNLLKPENKTKLAAILTYHIVPGRKGLTTLKSGKLRTLSGKELDIKVENNAISVNGANVLLPEIVGLNGTIYIIDQVILPN